MPSMSLQGYEGRPKWKYVGLKALTSKGSQHTHKVQVSDAVKNEWKGFRLKMEFRMKKSQISTWLPLKP